MKIPKQINVKTALIFVAIGILITSLVFYAFASTPSSTFYISSGVYPGAPSFTVWREGNNYFAKDSNGQLKHSGTNASQITQNCVNQLNYDDGGVLFFCNEQYVFDTPISIAKKGVRIIGESTDGVIFKFSYSGILLLFYNTSSTPSSTYTKECEVSSLTIEGANDGAKNQYGIYFNNSKLGLITNIDIHYLQGNGENWPIVLEGSHATEVTNSKFWNCMGGVKINGTYDTVCKIDHVWFDRGSQYHSTAIYSDGAGTMIQNCVFDGYILRVHLASNDMRVYGSHFETGNASVVDIKVQGLRNQIFGNSLTNGVTIITADHQTKFSGNNGFIITNTGQNATSSSTTVSFAHGLQNGTHGGLTPTFVAVSFNLTGWTSWKWSSTSTQITVTVETSGTYAVYWYAEYKP